MASLLSALQVLEAYPGLCNLSIDKVSLYSRLISRLRNDIILAQPAVEITDPPEVIPLSIAEFLAAALHISLEDVQVSWDILKEHMWNSSKEVAIGGEECEMFKNFGWDRGLTAYTIYPPGHHCSNQSCNNTKFMKKETSRRVVVYTLAHGVQPAWDISLYCPNCHSNYHNNFVVRDGWRLYYAGIPHYIQVGEHQFVEQRVIKMWVNMMLVGWVSASNAAKLYELSFTTAHLQSHEWQFGQHLSTEHVWDGFVIYSLLSDKQRHGEELQVPHTGDQMDRFTQAMKERNRNMILHGQPDAVMHACDKCLRLYKLDGSDELRYCHPIVGDGLSIGRPCCGIFRCRNNLESNRHRFCKEHFGMHRVCAINDCNQPVFGEGSKTCSDPEHTQAEVKYKEKGASLFLLSQRFRNTQLAESLNPSEIYQANHVDSDDVEWFELNDTGGMRVESRPNPGTIGVADDTAVPEPCPSKSVAGNRVLKAQFGRRRTHNEQTLVRPCGIIYARATMFGAEAVSNFLVMVQNAFSVPGARKPEHIFYDTNCDARQQAEKNPWFGGIGMCVDVWHFKNKHKVTHEYCQKYCNPIQYPELLNENGKWYFNTSVAEQINAWLGGFLSICRDMLPTKYDFFLDEMIRLRNVEHLKKLEKDGHNPRFID